MKPGLLTALCLCLLGATLLYRPVDARAQTPGPTETRGMPDLRTMAGRPLPVSDIPAGTVSIRMARQMPMNGAPGVSITATLTRPDADAIEIKNETGEDGRASFTDLPAGAEFQAETTVDGELLRTAKFVVPRSSGVRVMLIAGIGAPPPPTDQVAVKLESQRSRFDIEAVSGSTEASLDLPAGAIEIVVQGDQGVRLANQDVLVAEVHQSGDVNAHEGRTTENGTVRIDNLSTGASVLYVAVTQLTGLSLGSRPFNLPDDRGMRVRLQPLGVTDDPSVLVVDETSKLIIEPREEYIFIAQLISFQNTSDKIFDPGVKGLLIPLPDEFTGAQAFSGGATIEVIKDMGIIVRERIVPARKRRRQHEAQFGFLLPTYGNGEVTVSQTFPHGMKSPLVLIPESTKLGIRGPGMKTLPKQEDREKNPVALFEFPEVKPGGTLTFTITGLPVVPRTGRYVAVVLVAGLTLWALLGTRRPRDEARLKKERQKQDLINRREKLFAELVTLEQTRRQSGGDTNGKRTALVETLETVYRDLAALERGLPS